MAKTNPERTYGRKDLDTARWGGYQEGLKLALEVAESQLRQARRYFEERGGVVAGSREEGVLGGIGSVVSALKRELR